MNFKIIFIIKYDIMILSDLCLSVQHMYEKRKEKIMVTKRDTNIIRLHTHTHTTRF